MGKMEGRGFEEIKDREGYSYDGHYAADKLCFGVLWAIHQ